MAKINNLDQYNSDQHFTPKEIFQKLDCLFDLDVAGYHGQNHVPAKKTYCECCFDGLIEKWFGLVWCNPPYSKPTPWVDKFIEYNNGICLIPITRGKWWDRVWESPGLIIPNVYNFKFVRPNGEKRDITFRTMLLGLGEGKQILINSNLGKVR